MVELSAERIEQILHKETAKKEELPLILRGIYTRYMRLFERYFADIDALNDEKIAELKKYHEETGSLVRHYYMDIPMDVCMGIKEFENRYVANLLGPEWHGYLFDSYEDFREDNWHGNESEKALKAAFTRERLEAFYEIMDYIFRDDFGTGSQAAKDAVSRITGMLLGNE